MKNAIETELDRQVQEGIRIPVEVSEWATPIVPIVKNDKSIRICGDYKLMVNQAAKLDNYPIPRTENILMTFAGKTFSKIDLSQAYQQVLLDYESQELVALNTHKGLFRPTRLTFGIHSAPAIFQRQMERKLQNIPYVKVRIDDILVSEVDDEEHIYPGFLLLLKKQDSD